MTKIREPSLIVLETTTVSRAPSSIESNSLPGERRPEFSAETIPPVMRVLLFSLTLISTGLLVMVVLAAFVWSDGMLHLGAPFLAGFGGLSFALFLVFGGLIQNNRALGKNARGLWFLALLLTGPLGMLLYTMQHVLGSRYAVRGVNS